MMTLRRFLRQRQVEQRLSHRVTRYVRTRMRMKQTLSNISEEEVSALELLSSSLTTELRFAIFRLHLGRHPLFGLWITLEPVPAKHLCANYARFQLLQPEDELFQVDTQGFCVYYLTSGQLK